MTHPDPTPLIAALNAWDRNDIYVPVAAVCETSVQGLPEAPRELIALLPEPHRSFMRKACGPTYESLTFEAPETITPFDPTADMLPEANETAAGREARAQATRYFEARPITQVRASGSDIGADLQITLRIVHDAQGPRGFGFLQVSD